MVVPGAEVEVVAPGLMVVLIAGVVVLAVASALGEAPRPLYRPKWVSGRDVCASVASACGLAYARSGSLRWRQ